MAQSGPPNCKSFGCQKSKKGTGKAECQNQQKPHPSTTEGDSSNLSIRDFINTQYESPWILRVFGATEKQMLKTCLPSLAFFGLVGMVAVVYFCDWKPIARHLPYYGGKFEEDQVPKKKKKKKKKVVEPEDGVD
ncbi:hypothetical protein Trydic_g3196 [Trypoxylus dichotomus]